jgi:2-methylcitrate dehydratase
MGSISQKMAEFAIGIEYNDLPGEVVKEAKRFLIDSIGCAFAALNSEDMQAMYRVIQALGGTEEARIIGYGHRTNAPNAALMNNLLIRALDPGIREVGWHHASLTQFVSPLVAGKLYDLNVDQLVAAVGISGSSHFTLGGVVAGHLTNMKNTADPLAAQAGVYAAMMAREGYTGPVEVIEGKEGLIEVLSNVSWNTEELTKGLGSDFLITKCSYKAFPTEALTHQPISATLAICKRNSISYQDVEEILVETTTRGADILSDPSKYQPNTKETADHSLPYVIAVAVADGNVLPKAFTDEAIRDPRIWELLPKIKVVADPEIDSLFPQVKRARVTITTVDGNRDTEQTDFAKGAPENPLTDDELEKKFRSNLDGLVTSERMEDILRASWNLENEDYVADYVGIVVADGLGK